MLKKLINEPLTHFLLIGLVLFVFFQFNNPESDTTLKPLTLPQGLEKQLQSNFKALWQREPNQDELKLMKEQKIFESVLVQEALTLELHKHDEQIKKRLLQQIISIMSTQSSEEEPSQELLREYYQKNEKDYAKRERVSFRAINVTHLSKIQQITFAKNLMHTDMSNNEVSLFNDSNFESLTVEEIERQFGRFFTVSLLQLKASKWQGPLLAKNKVYYIYITKTTNKGMMSFDEVIDRVYADYLDEKKEKRLMQNYEQALKQYKIEQ